METLYKLREKWSETPKLLQKFEHSNSWIQDRDGSKYAMEKLKIS